VFGDYLDNARLRPNAKLKDVLANMQAYERFIGHEGSEHPQLFKRFKEDKEGFDAHYQPLLRVCIYRDKTFCAEWEKISLFLSPWDMRALRRASQAFAIARMVKFYQVEKCLDQAIIIASHIGSEDQILMDAWLRTRIRAAFRDRFIEGVDFVARFKATLLGRSERERLLRAELLRHGLELRSESNTCKRYIEGDTDASLQEVVATVKLITALFTHGGSRCFSKNFTRLRARMARHMKEMRYSCWYQACDAALATR